MIRRFLHEQKGMAIVEFAFIVPVLLLFYVGMAELCQALMAERKSSHAAAAIADLVAQDDQITPAEIVGIMNISGEILRPFPVDENFKVRVSAVTVNSSNVAKVTWSENRHWSDRSKDSNVSLPQVGNGSGGSKNFLAAGESVVMSEVEYTFSTPFSELFTQVQKLALGGANIHDGSYTFKATYFLRPRRSEQVTCSSC